MTDTPTETLVAELHAHYVHGWQAGDAATEAQLLCNKAADLLTTQSALIETLRGERDDIVREHTMAVIAESQARRRAEAAEAALADARDKALEEGAKWIRAQMTGADDTEYHAGYDDGLKAAANLLSAAPLREILSNALKSA